MNENTKSKQSRKNKLKEPELETTIKEKDTLIQNQINDIKRLQADFENYIKRTNKEKEELKEISKQELIVKLLNIIDDFDKAVSHLNKEDENTQGINMIYNQLISFLQENQIKPINSIGEKSDPFKHEVIKKIESNEEEGRIIEEIQKGYLFKDQVLRHSKVIISNGKKENQNIHGGNSK